MKCIRSIFILIICISININADDVELEVQSNIMLKMLREMANQTSAADSLNLPANASSIRENITDTFSCENRTYGYYADVDNDCQIFHVCLPSQSSSGRNVTYRWSFICPNETVFNQEVLVCTRPIDSIPCEESPMYYYMNNEIGKIPNNTVNNETNTQTTQQNTQANPQTGTYPQSNPQNTYSYSRKPSRRRPEQNKQNYIYEKLISDIVNKEMHNKVEDLGAQNENVENIFPIVDVPSEFEPSNLVNRDKIIIDDDRLIMERSLGRKDSVRFRGNI